MTCRAEVFQSGTREINVDWKHLAVARNCVYGQHSIRSTWYFSGNCINKMYKKQSACLYLILFVLFGKRFLFVLILKRKIGDQSFPSICVSLRRKNFINAFWATTFLHMATEKKNSVASWHLPKKVNFRPWLLKYFCSPWIRC